VIGKWHLLWYYLGMTMKGQIDSAGRIVIPKELRDRYGFKKGRVLSIVPLPDGISIVPELTERRFIRNGPLLSIDTGSGTASLADFDVDTVRDEQLRIKSP
jgi:AbrB family looped-hinge helix DNA binding protein